MAYSIDLQASALQEAGKKNSILKKLLLKALTETTFMKFLKMD